MFGLDRHVSTKCVDTRRVHARVRTLRDGCVQTFLTYEVMSMHNFKHITPCLSHNFPQVHSKQSTTSRLFNLWTFSHYATFDLQGRLLVQIVTYEDVSVCNLSHNFSCFISTTTFPHKCIAYETRSCACSHTTRRVSAHFLTYEDMSMRYI